MTYLDWIGPSLAPIVLLSSAGCGLIIAATRGSSSLRRFLASAFLLSLLLVLGTFWIRLPQPSLIAVSSVEVAAAQASVQAREAWSWQWLAFVPALYVLVRHLVGLACLALAARRFAPGPLGLTSVRLWICHRARTAYAFGTLKPTIVLPDSYLDLDAATLAAIIRHEEAHLRQGDPTLIPFVSLLQGLLWWNPFVHVLGLAWRLESERAADDAALATGISPAKYARQLINLAQGLAGRTPLAGSAFIGRGRLKTRILAVVNPEIRRKTMKASHKYLTVGGCMAAALALSVAASARWHSAQAVSKQTAPPYRIILDHPELAPISTDGAMPAVKGIKLQRVGSEKDPEGLWWFEAVSPDGKTLKGTVKGVKGENQVITHGDLIFDKAVVTPDTPGGKSVPSLVGVTVVRPAARTAPKTVLDGNAGKTVRGVELKAPAAPRGTASQTAAPAAAPTADIPPADKVVEGVQIAPASPRFGGEAADGTKFVGTAVAPVAGK